MITQKELKKFLHYNQETGIFTRLIGVNQFMAGEPVGNDDGHGYLRTSIKGNRYSCHRLAWFYVHGIWPNKIDHINHIKTDNRIINLRSVSHGENAKNLSLYANNTSGVNGVHWCVKDKKWKAQLGYKQKVTYLGSYDDKFEAICARKSADNSHGFHENHGK